MDPTKTQPTTDPNPQAAARQRLVEIRDQLAAGLFDRADEANGLAVAYAAQTHVLLLGPPGSAKSLVARMFAESVMPADNGTGMDLLVARPDAEDQPGGAVDNHEANQYFQRLLGAFTTPEELFGPYNLPQLEQGVYERCLDGYLPTARFAYLDEIFNANQSLLTTLNTCLEEREFDQGTQRIQIPLRMAVGAANRYPEGDMSMEALYDRFLIRHWVGWVEDEDDFVALLAPSYTPVAPTTQLAPGDAELLIAARAAVQVPEPLIRQIARFKRELAAEGIECSTRRWKASVKLIQAQAMINGNAVAQPRDCMILADSLWDKHEQRAAIYSLLCKHFAPTLGKVQATLDAMIEQYNSADLGSCNGAELGLLRDELDKAIAIVESLDSTGTDQDVAEATATLGGMARNVCDAFDANMGLPPAAATSA